MIKHRPLRLLGLSSVLNNGVTYLKWPFHSSVVLTAAMSRFKRVVCVCVLGSRKEFQSKGFSNGMFGRDDRRSCHGYGVVVVATRAREILLASCQSGPSRASRRLDAAGLTYAEPVLGDCDLAYGRTTSKHSSVCCTVTV